MNGTNVRIYLNGERINKSTVEIIESSHNQVQYIIEGFLSINDRLINITGDNNEDVLISIDKMLYYFSNQQTATIKYKGILTINKEVKVYCESMELKFECEEAATYKLTFNVI